MDTITLKSLSFCGLHGYYDEERERGNNFEVDFEAHGNFRASSESDNLSLTFDYQLAASVAEEVMNGTSEKLIESLCLKIGDQLFARTPAVSTLRVTVRKLNPPLKHPALSAEVTMEWKR